MPMIARPPVEPVVLEDLQRRLDVVADVQVGGAGLDGRAQDGHAEAIEGAGGVEDHVVSGQGLPEGALIADVQPQALHPLVAQRGHEAACRLAVEVGDGQALNLGLPQQGAHRLTAHVPVSAQAKHTHGDLLPGRTALAIWP
jgi:hypothetical protein